MLLLTALTITAAATDFHHLVVHQQPAISMSVLRDAHQCSNHTTNNCHQYVQSQMRPRCHLICEIGL